MPTSVTSLGLSVLFTVLTIVGMIANMFEGCDWAFTLSAAIACLVLSIVSFVKGD